MIFTNPLHVGRPNITDREAYLKLVSDMLERRWLTNDGPLVKRFEENLAKYLGVPHVVAMCNATIALEIAARALNFEGEVIVPSYTFVATAHAVHWQGITPVFADIDPRTHCLDPDSVRRCITPKTSGVIGVHLWGTPAPVEELQAVCDEHGLRLMFDAAHAFGVTHGGRRIGGFGRCEVFSFHATKFLNSIEGGAVATHDGELAEKIRLMRNFGFQGFDNVVYAGTNGKMTEVCAAMGIVNLENVDQILDANRVNYQAYVNGLANIPGIKLYTFNSNEQNNFQYIVVEVDDRFGVSRDELVAALTRENVLARKYFWPGTHKMEPYRRLFPWVDRLLPETNRIAGRVVVLPTGMQVKPDDVERICALIADIGKMR